MSALGKLSTGPADRLPLKSRDAMPCFRETVNDQGAGRVWFVMLADGFLLDCGHGLYCEQRARTLASIINAAGTERLSQDGLKESRHD